MFLKILLFDLCPLVSFIAEILCCPFLPVLLELKLKVFCLVLFIEETEAAVLALIYDEER